MATVSNKKARVRDTYMKLVLRCPLRPIKNTEQHAAASAMISELMGRKLDAGGADYLDTQILLVTRYEEQHEPIGDFASPQDAVRALMKANNLSQSDLGKIVGGESAISMFLRGTRELSKKHIKLLAAHFKLEPGLFF